MLLSYHSKILCLKGCNFSGKSSLFGPPSSGQQAAALRNADLDHDPFFPSLETSSNQPPAPIPSSPHLHFDDSNNGQAISKLITPIRYKGSPFVYKRREHIDEPMPPPVSATTPPGLDTTLSEDSPSTSHSPLPQSEWKQYI